ncbi:MAG: PilZ domain-containing protein [bacterium]|nr:PilZ domain-containing protein [bacterium]MDT8366619.1 PilZ domain-containing protein [bacterium]
MRRILVIDSANIFTQHVELVVSRYGYGTKGVSSAREALEALVHEGVDLVIAQESLPDMTWSDFCRRAGTDSSCSGVPVVVLSSDPASFDLQGCEGINVAGVRTKPISMRDLIAVVQRYLPYKNKRRQIRAPLAMKAMIRKGEELVPCRVLNLSEGGVFIMKKDPLPMDTDVHLLLFLDEVETPLEVSGKVVYVVEKARGKHPPGMGVQFNELKPDTREKLFQHLDDHVSSILGR